MSTLHKAWENIPLQGDLCLITASQIKELTGQEPRLMMKWDHSARRPPALILGNRFILPVKNGVYAVIEGQGYHVPETCPAPCDFPMRTLFELETSQCGISEMQYLDLAFNCGLVADFVQEPVLYPSLRGRKYSPSFSFFVGRYQLDVESVQIEIDQGYEGPDCILIVEAKIGEHQDFHLRQLYYPYRAWSQQSSKQVRPIFFTYQPETGLYRFREYAFIPADTYQAPKLIKAACYRLTPAPPLTSLDTNITRATPIPQADNLSLIAQIPVLVALGYNTPKMLAKKLKFNSRQGQYYLNAAVTLGLIDTTPYRLSSSGQSYVQASTLQREKILAQAILKIPLIQEFLINLLLAPDGKLERVDLEKIIYHSSKLNQITTCRRAQTLWAWLYWVAQRQIAFSMNKNFITIHSDNLKPKSFPCQLALF